MLNTTDNEKATRILSDVYIVTCNEENEVFFGDLEIRDGRIAGFVKKEAPLSGVHSRVVTPAFHNLHMHLGETIFRGRCDGMDLFGYLDVSHDSYENELWKKNESRIHRLSGLVSFMESVRNGCGIFACSRGTDEAEKMGIKAWCLFPIVNISKLQNYYRDSEGLRNIDVGDPSRRVKSSLFVQSLYLADEEKLDAVAKAMRENSKLKLFIHVSETLKEIAYVSEKYNMTPIEVLYSKGLLGRRTFCVHCVHLTEHDISLLKETETNVILCPISNMKLQSGFPDIRKLRESGINLLASPDGFATNNSASLLEELKMIALNDNKADVSDLLKLLTVNPARVLCEENEIPYAGTLSPGAKADIAVFDTMSYLCRDTGRIVNNLIFDFTDFECVSLYIDGNPVYEDRVFTGVSEEDVINQFTKLQQEVFYE